MTGSVVTKDIPSHCVAAGNPCKVIRPITQEDHERWKREYEEYHRISTPDPVTTQLNETDGYDKMLADGLETLNEKVKEQK